MTGWQPYRPPWYPEDEPEPLAQTGDTGPAAGTHYQKWTEKIGGEELQRRIAEWRESQAAKA